jgi:hypothetical protein
MVKKPARYTGLRKQLGFIIHVFNNHLSTAVVICRHVVTRGCFGKYVQIIVACFIVKNLSGATMKNDGNLSERQVYMPRFERGPTEAGASITIPQRPAAGCGVDSPH